MSRHVSVANLPTVSMRIRDVLHRLAVRDRVAADQQAEAAAKVRFAPRVAANNGQPTDADLKALRKAEDALTEARKLPRGNSQRAKRLDAAAAQLQAVEDRIALRQQSADNADALVEAGQLERLRGGKVVEDDPRHAPGRRRRVTEDGLDDVKALWMAAETPSTGLTFRRAWVAGMMFRHIYEAEHGSDVRCQLRDSDGGGIMAAISAAEMAMLSHARAGKLYRDISKAFTSSPRGAREWAVLCQVAGCGRSLWSMGGGSKSRHLWKLALLRALDTVAWVLRLP